MATIKFFKHPSAVLDFSLDWSDFLTGGDTISASTWAVSAAGIVIDADNFTTRTTTAWVSSGTANIRYDLVNYIETTLGREDHKVVSIFVMDEPNELSDLIYDLRIHLGDMNPSTYRYTDEWLHVALESSIKALQRWWGNKYVFNTTGDHIIRNPDYTGFVATSPPEIQDRDIRPIILMASILIKSGQLESNSWNVGSWKDAEIAVSNIEGNRAKEFGIKLDWEELKMYVLPPTKRLVGALRIAHPEPEE